MGQQDRQSLIIDGPEILTFPDREISLFQAILWSLTPQLGDTLDVIFRVSVEIPPDVDVCLGKPRHLMW